MGIDQVTKILAQFFNFSDYITTITFLRDSISVSITRLSINY